MNEDKDFCPLIKSQCIETNCALFNLDNDAACAFVSIAVSMHDAADALKGELNVRGSIDTYEQNA